MAQALAEAPSASGALSSAGGTTNLLATTHTVAAGLLPVNADAAGDVSAPLGNGAVLDGAALDDATLEDLDAPPALPAAWHGARVLAR